MGVWIEITPQRAIGRTNSVTPHVGVWIEILKTGYVRAVLVVTPHVGVWIEISSLIAVSSVVQSLPTWECGLKSWRNTDVSDQRGVTPHVGVWIEIVVNASDQTTSYCHSPRGSVD